MYFIYLYDNVIGAVMCNVSSESEKGNVKSSSQAVESPVGGQRGGQNETLTAEELRKRRQAYFDRWVELHILSERFYIGSKPLCPLYDICC